MNTEVGLLQPVTLSSTQSLPAPAAPTVGGSVGQAAVHPLSLSSEVCNTDHLHSPASPVPILNLFLWHMFCSHYPNDNYLRLELYCRPPCRPSLDSLHSQNSSSQNTSDHARHAALRRKYRTSFHFICGQGKLGLNCLSSMKHNKGGRNCKVPAVAS